MPKKQKFFQLDDEWLLMLGENPEEAVGYLERKDATEINPVHVKALLRLKASAVSSS